VTLPPPFVVVWAAGAAVTVNEGEPPESTDVVEVLDVLDVLDELDEVEDELDDEDESGVEDDDDEDSSGRGRPGGSISPSTAHGLSPTFGHQKKSSWQHCSGG
jgi:hypothetical protein